MATWGNPLLLKTRREGSSGQAELHERQADLIVVQSGHATIIIGGKIINGQTTAPNEIRGTSIEGGEKQSLRTGGVLQVPAKTPTKYCWTLGMVEVHQSGAPLSWGNYIFNSNIKNIQLPDSQQTVARWFNTGAGFNTSSSQQLANNLRTFPIRFSGIRADGATGWNFSMIRNYHIHERIEMQFPAEFFNTLNHPVFAAPNTTPTSSAFGTVTNSASEPRSIDFSLKFVF